MSTGDCGRLRCETAMADCDGELADQLAHTWVARAVKGGGLMPGAGMSRA